MIKNKYLINIIQLTSIPISQVIRNLVIVFLMSKFLPISEVGIWGQVLAVHTFLYMFINLNLTHSMTRFLPSQKENLIKNSQIFFGVLIIVIINSLVISIVMNFFSDFFASILFTSKQYNYIFIYLAFFIILENIYNIIHSYLRSLQEFYYQSILTLFRTFFELFIIGGGIYYFYYINTLNIKIVFILFFISLILSILIGYYILCKKGLLIFTKIDFSFLKEYLDFGIPQLPANLSYWIINLSDRLFITYFLGLKALGIYFIANRIGMIVTFPLSPIGTLLYTELSKRYDNDKELFEKKIIVFYSIFIILVGILTYVLAINFIEYFVKENKKEILDVVFIIIVSLVFYNIFSILNIFDSVKKHSKRIGKIWSLVAIVNIIFNIILIPIIGIMGAVYSSMIAYIVGIISRRFIK